VSASVIPFEQAREAWFAWRKDSRLSHADQAILLVIYRYFNRQHYDRTRELVAWPGWDLIGREARVSKTSLFRGFRRFEKLGVLEITRGRDPKTGRKLPNSYRALMPPPGFAVIPGVQVPPCTKSRFRRESRLSEVDSLKIKNGKFENGNPRGPSAPGSESEAERKARWEREGKSPFTGIPKWTRGFAVNGGGTTTVSS
jgi:hypothetical protein